MKYLFIINPCAGDGTKNKELEEKLKPYEGKHDIEIHKTTGEKEATEFVSKYLDNHSEEEITVVACGGDGSLNEVVNGVFGHKNAILAIYASGSGNDFIKYFGKREDFLDLDSLFEGDVKEIDCLTVDDKKTKKICINVCHFGFDSYVAATANEIKKKGGKDPYGVGVKKAILHGRRNKIFVKADGNLINPKGIMLLCTLGNGSYVGGKYYCAPKAVIDDGLIDVGFVFPCTLLGFVNLIGKYEKGQHIDNPKFKKILRYSRAKSVEIYNDKPFDISIDGEVIRSDYFKVNVEQKAIRFLVPKK